MKKVRETLLAYLIYSLLQNVSMSSSPSLTQTAAVLLIVVAILVGSPFAIASLQQAGLTQAEQQEVNQMVSVQGLTTQYLEEGDKQLGGLIFTPRWGDVVFVEPSLVTVLFADCLPGEFAVSGQQILGGSELGGSDLNLLESYAFAMPNDYMTWFMVVENLNNNQRLPASAGVICVSDRDIDVENSASTIILRPEFKQQINNIIKNIIKIENNQIVNLQQIFNIRQQLVQNAVQIAIGGGNVTQIINQAASQIVASNGTNISQILNQTASQTVAPSTGATINQLINQTGNQTVAPSTGATINQLIDQAANQTAGGGGVTTDTSPPTLIVPEEVQADDGAEVTYTVTAQDNVDGIAVLEEDGFSVTQDNIGGSITISCNPASGSTFSIGDTDVDCSATDAAGNTGTESFTATVGNSTSTDE